MLNAKKREHGTQAYGQQRPQDTHDASVDVTSDTPKHVDPKVIGASVVSVTHKLGGSNFDFQRLLSLERVGDKANRLGFLQKRFGPLNICIGWNC